MVTRLQKFLDSQRIKYQILLHSKAFTAQEVAESAQISGKLLAKTVMMMVEGIPMMILLPAFLDVDMDALSAQLEQREVRLATEKECADLFPHCEVGAWPAFGTIWEIPMMIDRQLAEHRDFIGYTGKLNELIRLRMSDFLKVMKPEICDLSATDRSSSIFRRLFA